MEHRVPRGCEKAVLQYKNDQIKTASHFSFKS